MNPLVPPDCTSLKQFKNIKFHKKMFRSSPKQLDNEGLNKRTSNRSKQYEAYDARLEIIALHEAFSTLDYDYDYLLGTIFRLRLIHMWCCSG